MALRQSFKSLNLKLSSSTVPSLTRSFKLSTLSFSTSTSSSSTTTIKKDYHHGKEEYVPFALADVKDPFASANAEWKAYRVVTALMLPVYGLGIVFDNILIDLAIVALTVPHCHFGLHESLTDYLHPRKFGLLGTGASYLLAGATGLVTIGLLYLIFFDKGLTRTVKSILKQ